MQSLTGLPCNVCLNNPFPPPKKYHTCTFSGIVQDNTTSHASMQPPLCISPHVLHALNHLRCAKRGAAYRQCAALNRSPTARAAGRCKHSPALYAQPLLRTHNFLQTGPACCIGVYVSTTSQCKLCFNNASNPHRFICHARACVNWYA